MTWTCRYRLEPMSYYFESKQVKFKDRNCYLKIMMMRYHRWANSLEKKEQFRKLVNGIKVCAIWKLGKKKEKSYEGVKFINYPTNRNNTTILLSCWNNFGVYSFGTVCPTSNIACRRFHKELGLVLSPVRTSNSS